MARCSGKFKIHAKNRHKINLFQWPSIHLLENFCKLLPWEKLLSINNIARELATYFKCFLKLPNEQINRYIDISLVIVNICPFPPWRLQNKAYILLQVKLNLTAKIAHKYVRYEYFWFGDKYLETHRFYLFIYLLFRLHVCRSG